MPVIHTNKQTYHQQFRSLNILLLISRSCRLLKIKAENT